MNMVQVDDSEWANKVKMFGKILRENKLNF